MPKTLTCDASPHEVGVIISHLMQYQPARPIAFTSGFPTFEEENKIQTEKLCV